MNMKWLFRSAWKCLYKWIFSFESRLNAGAFILNAKEEVVLHVRADAKWCGENVPGQRVALARSLYLAVQQVVRSW